MQNVDSTYQQIQSGEHTTEYRVHLFSETSEDERTQVRVVISNPSTVERTRLPLVSIEPSVWEASTYGGVNGTYEFENTVGDGWVYIVSRSPLVTQVISDISTLGITVTNRINTGVYLAAGDTITVVRSIRTDSILHTFGESEIVSVSFVGNLFSGDAPGIGGCYSSQATIELRNGSEAIPKMGKLQVEFRITNGTLTSRWYSAGYFYVDTRDPDPDLQTIRLTCYDSMLKTEQEYRKLTKITKWPASQLTVATEICKLIGIELESSSFPSTTYSVRIPLKKTMREVLSEIAVANCGNFVITAGDPRESGVTPSWGKLRFIPFKGMNRANPYNLDSKYSEFRPATAFKPFTQVTLWTDDNNYVGYPYCTYDAETWLNGKYGGTNGDHEFVYNANGMNWNYQGNVVKLGDFGLNFVGPVYTGDKINIMREQDISLYAVRQSKTIAATVDKATWDAYQGTSSNNNTQVFLSFLNGNWMFDAAATLLDLLGIDTQTLGLDFFTGDELTVKQSTGTVYKPTCTAPSGLTVEVDEIQWTNSAIGKITDSAHIFTYTDSRGVMAIDSRGNQYSLTTNRLWLNGPYAEHVGTLVFTYGAGVTSTVTGKLKCQGTASFRELINPTLIVNKYKWEASPLGGGTGTVNISGYRTLDVYPTQQFMRGNTTDSAIKIVGQNLSKWNASPFGTVSGRFTFRFTGSSTRSDGYWIYADGPELPKDKRITKVVLDDIGLTATITGNLENGDTIYVVRNSNVVWTYGGNPISLSDYGISIAGNLEAASSPFQISITRTTANGNCWKCTTDNKCYAQGELGLAFDQPIAGSSSITVSSSVSVKAWTYKNSFVELENYGIYIKAGTPSVNDTISITSTKTTGATVEGTFTTAEQVLTIDQEIWDANTDIGGVDGTFTFTYSKSANHWWYTNDEGNIVSVELGQYGINYPNNYPKNDGDQIVITRESEDPTVTAEVITTGRELSGFCSWADKDMATTIYNYIYGFVYTPFEAEEVLHDLALEIGDCIKPNANGSTYLLTNMETRLDHLPESDLGATSDDEVDHEYKYKSQTTKSLERKLTLGESYGGVSVSYDNGFSVTGNNGNSEIIFNDDIFTMRAKIGGQMKDRIYFDPVKGDYVFSGSLSADAIFTESLYAENGDIADLTVDRLSTSRKVRNYLLSNVEHENFIRIEGEKLEFVTANVRMANGISLCESMTNREGKRMYWSREISKISSDGYPFDADGKRIYLTETVTSYPCMVYQYDELVKMAWSFKDFGSYETPIIMLGAGDGQGGSQGYIQKTTNGIEISYVTSAGQKTYALKMGDDGLTVVDIANGTETVRGTVLSSQEGHGIAHANGWHQLGNITYGCSWYQDISISGAKVGSSGYLVFDPSNEEIRRMGSVSEVVEDNKVRVYAYSQPLNAIAIMFVQTSK